MSDERRCLSFGFFGVIQSPSVSCWTSPRPCSCMTKPWLSALICYTDCHRRTCLPVECPKHFVAKVTTCLKHAAGFKFWIIIYLQNWMRSINILFLYYFHTSERISTSAKVMFSPVCVCLMSGLILETWNKIEIMPGCHTGPPVSLPFPRWLQLHKQRHEDRNCGLPD